MATLPQIRESDLEAPIMDIERNLIMELQKLDLTLNEARILLYLMANGHSSVSDITRDTGIRRTETYNYVSTLLSKGVIFCTFDSPQKYYPMSLEEVVDHLLECKRHAIRAFENNKEKYSAMFDALVQNRAVRNGDKRSYNVIIGENAINSKISKMLSDAGNEVLILLSERNMINLYHAGITDQLIELATNDVQIKLTTTCKEPEKYLVGKCARALYNTTTKTLPASFVEVDGSEVIIILEGNSEKKADRCAFYTNNACLVSVFQFLFENVG